MMKAVKTAKQLLRGEYEHKNKNENENKNGNENGNVALLPLTHPDPGSHHPDSESLRDSDTDSDIDHVCLSSDKTNGKTNGKTNTNTSNGNTNGNGSTHNSDLYSINLSSTVKHTNANTLSPTPTQTDTIKTPQTSTTPLGKSRVSKLWNIEVLPGNLFGNLEIEKNFSAYFVKFGSTYFHASGTCGMDVSTASHGEVKKGEGNGVEKYNVNGINMNERNNINNENNTINNNYNTPHNNTTPHINTPHNNLSIVDSQFRVKNTVSLRIVDASVFPLIPSGPTSATCMAIGLIAGELILESK